MIKFKAYLTGFLLAWFILYANTAWSLSTPAPLPSAVMHNSIIEIGKMKPKPRLDKKKKGTGTQAHRQQIIKQIERRQWEREALETLKQQIRKPNPSEQMYFTFLKGGLVFQEGGPNGGRTIEYYVGLSEKGLKTRYTYDKALMRPDGTKIDYVSTFRSLREAELLIEKTMQENMKTSQGRKDMSDLVKGARQELIWQHNFHSSTGHMLNGPKGDIIDAYGVQVRLRHADSTNGWRLLEAMPVRGRHNNNGNLVITGTRFTISELNAAHYMAGLGYNVILRDAVGTRQDGTTSDLLVDGIRYDVYTPISSNHNTIIKGIRRKNQQAEVVILDLSQTTVKLEDLGDIKTRIHGAGGTNIRDIIIIGR